MKARLVGIIFVLGLCISPSVFAEMSSTNFIIRADALSSGGDNTSSSASYLLRDSVAGMAQGISSSSSYNLRSGFRPMVFDPVVSLNVGVQETDVSTTISSLVGTDVTVDSTSGFSVGDLVILGQDVSSSPVMAVGEVVSIVGSVITVDELVSNGSPVVDGTDDTLFRASGTSVSFGGLSNTLVTQRLIVWEVSVDVTNGFVVYLAEDADLQSGVNTITDVSDGEVTAGSTEYGARSSDTTLAGSTFDSEDAPVTSTLQQIGTVASGSASFDAKGYVELKASRSGLAQQGTYEHNLYVVASPTY